MIDHKLSKGLKKFEEGTTRASNVGRSKVTFGLIVTVFAAFMIVKAENGIPDYCIRTTELKNIYPGCHDKIKDISNVRKWKLFRC